MHPSLKNPSFWSALFIVVATAVLMYSVYYDIIQLHFSVGPYLFHHWLSWTGTIFVALFTPIYYFFKRRKPGNIKRLLGIHVFGNLFAFMFVSIHFTQQISRPVQFYPDLGTGIVLYFSFFLMVATGFDLRFHPCKRYNIWRFIHTSVAVTFYLIILVHILHGLGVI